jgi:hypothetical protein
MPTKSFLTSKTIWSAALLFIISQATQRGINLNDLVAPTGVVIEKLIHDGPGFFSDILQFGALIGVIAGRFTAAEKLHFVAPKVTPVVALMTIFCFAFSVGVTGCGSTAGGAGIGTNPAATVINAAPPLIAAPVVAKPTASQDLLSFAYALNNAAQTVNTGAVILAPEVSSAATLAQIFVHGQQSTAVLNKITTLANGVSSSAVAAGLPPQLVQAQVNAALTPAAAAAIVQQVQATVPAN